MDYSIVVREMSRKNKSDVENKDIYTVKICRLFTTINTTMKRGVQVVSEWGEAK